MTDGRQDEQLSAVPPDVRQQSERPDDAMLLDEAGREESIVVVDPHDGT